MNVDDPFASDLSNFDSIVAALEINVDKQQQQEHTNSKVSSSNSNINNNTNNTEYSRVRNAANSSTNASSTPFSAMMTQPALVSPAITVANQESNVHFLPTTSQVSSATHGRRANASVPASVVNTNTNTNNSNNSIANSNIRIQPVANVPSHATNNINNTVEVNNDDNDPLAWLNDDADNSSNNKNQNVIHNINSSINQKSEHETSNRPLVNNNTVNNDEDDPLAFLEVRPAALTQPTTNITTLHGNGNSSNALQVPWEINEMSSTQAHKNTIISEEEKLNTQKEEEMRELRATLTALTNEVQQKEQALISRQEKEEAALLELEVRICDKQNVLTEESHKAEATKAETERHLVQRKAEIAERLQKELKEQEEQMRQEGELRYRRQLQTLFNQIKECEGRVAKMREERDLIMERAPLSTQGVRLRLHKSILEESKENDQETNNVHAKQKLVSSTENSNNIFSGGDHLSVKNEGNDDGHESETNNKTNNNKSVHASRLDQAVAIVVSLLQSCGDQRVDVMRKNTVDFIHRETLNVSSAIHNSRVAAFRDECNEHKSKLDKQISDTITNHRAFMKKRQERNEAKLQSLRNTTQNAITELGKRQQAEEEQLWSKFQDKIADMTTHFNTSALETASLFETKAAQVLLNNKNVALAEQAKLQKRFELEERVQRQLFQSQENTLQEQFSRMHQLSEAESARQLASMEKDLTQSRLALESLASRIGKFTSQVDGKAQNVYTLIQESTNNTGMHTNSNEVGSDDKNNTNAIHVSSKEIEELDHINQSLLHELEKRTNALLEQKSEIHHSQLRLLHMIDNECVQTFQTRQAAQHAAECEQNFIRTSWEKAYLQHLSIPFTLNVPVHVAHDKPLKFLQACNLPSNEHITPSTKINDDCRSTYTTHLPITTGTEMTQTSVETYSPPALMTATALLDVIVAQLEEKTALEKECRNEMTSHVKEQVEAVKELQARSKHFHHSWIALIEQLHQLDKERETVHHQLTHVTVESIKANCEEEKLRVEHVQLEQRRKELTQQLTLLKKEKKQVQVEYKDHIHHLRHMQLKMLCNPNMKDKSKCVDKYALSYTTNTASSVAAAAAGVATSTSSRETTLRNKLTNKPHDINRNEIPWNTHSGKHYYKELRKIMSRTSTPTPPMSSSNLLLDDDDVTNKGNAGKISTHRNHYKQNAHEHHHSTSTQDKARPSRHCQLSYKQEEEEKHDKDHQYHHHHRETNYRTSSSKHRSAAMDTSTINNLKRDHSDKWANKRICNGGDNDIISNKRHKHKHRLGYSERKHNELHAFHPSRIHSSQSSPAAITSSCLTTETSSVQDTRIRANSSSSSSSSFSTSSSNAEESLLSSMQLLPPPPQLPTHRVNGNHDSNNMSLHERTTHSHASKQNAANVHHRRAASMHSCSHDESLCSSSSVYRVASFTDLLPLADSTNTSACTARE